MSIDIVTSMNRVTEILGVKYPIVQAPMGWIARSQLASAVSNAGGFGVIETSSGETENCKAEILAMSELTDKPFGVNLPGLRKPGLHTTLVVELATRNCSL